MLFGVCGVKNLLHVYLQEDPIVDLQSLSNVPFSMLSLHLDAEERLKIIIIIIIKHIGKYRKKRIPKESPQAQNKKKWKCCSLGMIEPVYER